MKNILFVLSACCFLVLACERYDDSELRENMASLQDRVENLEKMKDELRVLKQIVEGKVTVISCVENNGKCVITFSDGSVISVGSSSVSEKGIPFVTVVEKDDKTCWGVYANGKAEVLLVGGKPLEVAASQAPQLRICDDGYLEVSADGGTTWVKSDSKVASSVFLAVEKLEDSVVLTLSDGETRFIVPFLDEREFQFIAMGGAQFFSPGQTISIPIEMSGVEEYTVTERPQGWNVVLSDTHLVITAPALNAGETSGYIKMLGIGKETKIAKIYVSIGEAPCTLSIDDLWQVTITPKANTCFYGASLIEDFNPASIAAEYTGLTPLQSRRLYTDVEAVVAMEDLVGERVDGNVYVFWSLPYNSAGYKASDVLYIAVSSIGVRSEVSNVSFDDASITVSVSGADAYYLISMREDQTLNNIISDINGAFAASFDKLKHNTVYRGKLTYFEYFPQPDTEYRFLVLPVKHGSVVQSEAEYFYVKLAPFTFGGGPTVALQQSVVDFKSASAKVSAGEGAYKILAGVLSDSEYTAGGYADDTVLQTYLSGLNPVTYTADYIYTAKNLAATSDYWIVAAAIDRSGAIGAPSRLAVKTGAVEYSDARVIIGEPELSYSTARIPVTASEDMESYRYFVFSSDGGGYQYSNYVDNDAGAYNDLVYGIVDYESVSPSEIASGIYLEDLRFGTQYILRIIGVDKSGKVTGLAKLDFTPTVGTTIKFSDTRWGEAKPVVETSVSRNTMKLTISFPKDFISYVVARVSPEEYDAYMPAVARERADYVLGHMTAMTFNAPITSYKPDWYISTEKPYLLIAWQDENGWYEPMVYDSNDGTILNK